MAFLIDGISEEIAFASYAAIEATTTHTWAGWTFRNGDGGGGFQRVFDKRQTGDVGHVLWRLDGTNWGYDDFRWTTPRGRWSFPETTISQWVHVVLTYDGGDTGNEPVVYYNGVSQTVAVAGAPGGTHTNADTQELILGNRTDGSREFDGNMAEFGMWNRVLDAGEAAALAKGFTPDHIPNGLVLYAPLIRDANNRMAGNNGVVTGATVSVHPRVIRPSAQILQFPLLANTKTFTKAFVRHAQYGGVRMPYGSFASKEAAAPGGAVPLLTLLGVG